MTSHSYPVVSATTTTAVAPFTPPPAKDDDIDFLGVLDTILNARWLILSICMITLLLGGAYAFLSSPVYQSNILIQVEQSKDSSSKNPLTELATAFNIQSPATAEIEILRSRLVLGEAVDQLHPYIDVDASPNYLPVIGNWLGKHATAPSTPHTVEWKGYTFGGYVWGNESLELKQLDVPLALENKKLTLVVTATGYELEGPNDEKLAEGKVGIASEFGKGSTAGRILVDSLNAKPGARFTLVRYSRQNIIQNLQKNLIIDEIGKPSGVLSAALEGTDPEKTSRLLNAVGTAYVKQNTERTAAEAEKSLLFLDSFLPQLKSQMDAADNRYTAFRDEHSTFNLSTEGNLALSTSVALQSQLFELQQKRRELQTQFGNAHPSIQGVDNQVAALHTQIAGLTARIKALPELEQKLVNLERDAKINGELYASQLNSAQQLRLVKEGKVGNVRVVDTAILPEQPIRPNRALILAISAALGLMLGIGLALLRGLLRTGVNTANDIESSLGLNVLTTVPRVLPKTSRQLHIRNRSIPNYVLAESAPDDPAVESLRGLRSALRFALEEANNNIVMVTGPTPNLGKTFTSVNLAAVLGAADKRVLLIDADFRSGQIHRYFGLGRANGLSDLIQGNVPSEQVLHKNLIPNVDLITTGELPRNPAEMLLSPATIQLLQSLSADYDVVIIDTAPVLAVSDALALAHHVGTVFLLARAQITTLGELEESTKRLNQAGGQVKGVILNDFDANSHHFKSKYGHYGHSYYLYGSNQH